MRGHRLAAEARAEPASRQEECGKGERSRPPRSALRSGQQADVMRAPGGGTDWRHRPVRTWGGGGGGEVMTQL